METYQNLFNPSPWTMITKISHTEHWITQFGSCEIFPEDLINYCTKHGQKYHYITHIDWFCTNTFHIQLVLKNLYGVIPLQKIPTSKKSWVDLGILYNFTLIKANIYEWTYFFSHWFHDNWPLTVLQEVHIMKTGLWPYWILAHPLRL